MADLKLARIPDRTPVKQTITVLPELHQALQDYAAYLNGQSVSSPDRTRGSHEFLRNSPGSAASRVCAAVSRPVSASGAGGGA